MLKKILIIVSISTLILSSVFASNKKPSELMYLPHPVKIIMPNLKKLHITKTQEDRLNKEMLAHYPAIIQGMMKDIANMEKKIQREILKDNKTKIELKDSLDKLQKMKREVTNTHIDALNTLANILTKEQMQKTLKMINKKKEKSNKFKIDELVILPHPGKHIKQGKIVFTKEQKQRLKKEVKTTIIPKYQDKMREAFKLEKKLQRAVKNGKTKEELKTIIEKISLLKKEALLYRIDALNKVKEIMTKKQWEKSNKLTYK